MFNENKSTTTYPMNCDEKSEGYSTYKWNQTLQGQCYRNHLDLPVNLLLIFIEKWKKENIFAAAIT